ncbi:MAG: hypothetical protein IKI77_03570 [Oscillospiraceae bacterium]|nr:hypothetical protein [Oscillospiraceae bacterium]
MLEFTGFRKTNEEERNTLKTLGLKSALGTPLSLESFFLKSLITDDHAFVFISACFDDEEQRKAEKAHLRAEFGITSPYDTVPTEYLLLAGEAVIRVFAKVHGFQEGKTVKICRIAMPESLLPVEDSVKKMIRSAFFFWYAPDNESAEKYGIRLEYSDREAEIRIV